jgi:DNA repair exonuclease SbcCD ATPase subunit
MRTRALGIIAVATVFCAGCQQPETANEKRARLLAAENIELREQSAARQAETEALRQKHAQELQRRDEELAKCEARIETLQKDLEKGIAERVEAVTTAVTNENAKLRQENKSLKADVERLQGETQRRQVAARRLNAERDRLNAEIVRLNAEIERLKAEIERLQPPAEAEPQENP